MSRDFAAFFRPASNGYDRARQVCVVLLVLLLCCVWHALEAVNERLLTPLFYLANHMLGTLQHLTVSILSKVEHFERSQKRMFGGYTHATCAN